MRRHRQAYFFGDEAMKLKKLFAKRNSRWAITDKMLFSLFLTGATIELSQVGSGFVDGLLISRRLGSDAMAAAGIVYPIFSILGIISGLLAVGMEVRCSQAIGRGNREEYRRFVSAAVYAGIVISLIVTVLFVIFAKPFSALLGASGNGAGLVGPASEYLTGISIGAPALIMTAILAPALQLDSGRRFIQNGAIICVISNVVMDILAVCMNWGIFGIGLATAVANYLNLLAQCLFFLKKDRILHFVRPNIPAGEFIKMLANGSEKAIKRIANTLRPIVLNAIIISYGGAAAMSVLSVRNNFSDFAEIFGAGIASAVGLLTGVHYGEINEDGIEEVNKYEHRLIRYFSGSVCVLMLIFAGQIARLYIREDGEIYRMAVFAIRVLALQIPLQALIASRIKYLQAIRRKSNMILLIMVTQLIFVILSAFILGRLFGSYGILACYTVSDALTLAAVYIYYAVKCRSIRPPRKSFLNLPDYFHLHPGDVISLDIRNQLDVSLVSEQIMLFCKGHKLSDRTAYHAALSFEELASNIVSYGFPVNRSSHPIIDLRAVITNSSFVMRLRDNCPPYDVTKEFSAVNEPGSDPVHNIGIRIVSKTASDITYLNTFDTNNLIIQFLPDARSDSALPSTSPSKR